MIDREQLDARFSELSRKNLIGGTLRAFEADRCFDVIDPATSKVIGQAPLSGVVEVAQAVETAAASYRSWKDTPALERSRTMLRAADALESRQEELAQLISAETGRPLRTETRPEVANAVRIFRYFAGLPMEIKGETIQYSATTLSMTIREPIGVVGVIVPWNVPAMLFCLKVAPALAAGNTVVVKPAEQSPLCSLFLAKILAEILPPGILNIINGIGEEAGAALARHPNVKKLTFTGSVETGGIVYGQAAERLVPVTLELGGKSPMIIFPDVPLEKAIRLADVGMRFSRQGQSCTSTTRMYVHRAIFDKFLEGLCEHLAQLVIGDPLDELTDIGSLISANQMARVQKYIDEAKSTDGVTVMEPGQLPAQDRLLAGCYLRPTLVINPEHKSQLVQEEIFGPVVVIRAWEDIDAVLAEANGTKFGLSAAIVTTNLAAALKCARQIEAGFIQINSGLVIQPGIAFGGFKNSGIGREASLESMLEAFTQVKTILVDHS